MLVSDWPCKRYCGADGACECARGARREARARERQLQVYELHRVRPYVPWDNTQRITAHARILRNVPSTFAGDPLKSGEEVDRLVAATGIRADEHWRAVTRFIYHYARGHAAALGKGRIPRTAVEDIVSETLLKAVRAIKARAFLQASTPAREAHWAWHHLFTHYFAFRPWLARCVRNALVSELRAQDREAPLPGDLALPASSVHELVIEQVEHAHEFHHIPELLELIDQQRRYKRGVQMCHTLARLPRRYVAVVDEIRPGLSIGALPVARTDAEMAEHLKTTVGGVETSRYNFRAFVAERHPELKPTLELVLSLALGKLDRPGAD